MTYDIDFIKNNWLVEGSVPYSEKQMVDSFNCVVGLLGQDWIDRIKTNNGTEQTGPLVTVPIIELGLKLEVLKKAENNDSLIKKLKSKLETERIKGMSELNAIYFLCNENDIEFRLEPSVSRSNKTSSHPDFRLKKTAERDWTYVEVKQPDRSDKNKAVIDSISQIVNLLRSEKGFTSIEVMLQRNPSDEELQTLLNEIRSLVDEITTECEIPNLGLVKINHISGIYSPFNYSALNGKSAICQMNREPITDINGESILKSIVCRIAVSDDRAKRFLNGATKQLPQTSSCLIWIDNKNTLGFKEWGGILNDEFCKNPNIHEKISGVVMFSNNLGLDPSSNLLSEIYSTSFICNKGAKFQIPDWIRKKII